MSTTNERPMIEHGGHALTVEGWRSLMFLAGMIRPGSSYNEVRIHADGADVRLDGAGGALVLAALDRSKGDLDGASIILERQAALRPDQTRRVEHGGQVEHVVRGAPVLHQSGPEVEEE